MKNESYSIGIMENIKKIDIKNPKHLIAIGFGLITIALLKTVIIVAAIGLFLAAIIITSREVKDEKNNHA